MAKTLTRLGQQNRFWIGRDEQKLLKEINKDKAK